MLSAMNIDISTLKKAIAQADDALELSSSQFVKSDDRLALHLRAACIQAFEFTYELSVKMLKRYLEEMEASPSIVDEMSFNNLIRRGLEAGLLSADLASWKQFRKERGTTSHTYDAEKAELVFQSIPAFLKEAKYLASQIEARQDLE